jgi:hypothetical protein
MPNLGRHFLPSIDLDEACDIASIVSKEFKGRISVSGLADRMNMAVGGGAFRHKLAALARYGLLQGRGQLSTTSIAEQVAWGSPDEQSDAKAKAFLSIDLFGELAERLGADVPNDERLRVLVTEITGAPTRDVRANLPRLVRMYEGGARYLNAARRLPAVAPSTARPAEVAESIDQQSSIVPADTDHSVLSGRILLTDGEQRWIVPRTEQGLAILRRYIEVLQLQLDSDSPSED